MGRPIAIRRIIGISWWWLIAISMLEAGLRYYFKWQRFESVNFIHVWIYVQAVWLKRAEPQSRAIYWYAVSDFLSLGSVLIGWGITLPNWPDEVLTIAVLATGLIAIFTFRNELERHFNETDPIGLNLSGVMTFFFSIWYFQYHLHDIYKLKHQDQLSITPAAA